MKDLFWNTTMDLQARTGRHKQRYEGEFRLVSGCIPYRHKRIDKDHIDNWESSFEVLMISTPNRHDLVFPKGGWEDDETKSDAALREAWEEAGVRGNIEAELGCWEFKSKSRQDNDSREGICRGYMFAFEVREELDSWPEQASHERKWLMVRDAYKFCRYDWMRQALKEFEGVMSQDIKHAMREEAAAVAEVADQQNILPLCSVNACSWNCYVSA